MRISIGETPLSGAQAPLMRRRLLPRTVDGWLPFILLGPTFLLIVVVLLFPLLYNLRLSFFSWNIIKPEVFVGLENYQMILQDASFWNSVRVTGTFYVIAFSVEFFLGFGLALLLNRNIRGTRIFRTIILLPMMLTPVVLGLDWRMMYNLEFGVINYFFSALGLPTRAWAVDAATALPALAVVDVWHTTAFVTIVLASGLATLPGEPLEAAKIDGASVWQSLIYVTIPLMKPLILVVCLFRTIELIRIFDIVYTLTGGGPGRATETMSLHIFQQTFLGWQIGYGAAGSYILLVITLAIGLLFIRGIRADEVS